MTLTEFYELVRSVHAERSVPPNAFFVVVTSVTDPAAEQQKAYFVLVPPSEPGPETPDPDAVRQTLEKISSNEQVWASLLNASFEKGELN